MSDAPPVAPSRAPAAASATATRCTSSTTTRSGAGRCTASTRCSSGSRSRAFQSGLAWITVLRKRPAFRAAFADFDPEVVAEFGDDDVARLMADAGIVRNRAKIEATIANGRALRDAARVGRHARRRSCGRTPRTGPRTSGRPPGRTSRRRRPSRRALAKELKSLGFRFVGPVTAYAAMQACGVVDDHLATCPAVRGAVAPATRVRRRAGRLTRATRWYARRALTRAPGRARAG